MDYIIGIDLGTTNSSLAYVDLNHPGLPIQLFKIPQKTENQGIEFFHHLPSAVYLADEGYWVGVGAEALGAKTPTKGVFSAKSWLNHPISLTEEACLPIDGDAVKISPLKASYLILNHLREAWNGSFAKGEPDKEMEACQVYLTCPASFDEKARTLTLKAAHMAGLRQVTLLEEPLAAFLSYLSEHETREFPKGAQILVCDIGGGTCDLTLIESDEKNLKRQAVGDHLLLGGDNMDLYLAKLAEDRFAKRELSVQEWSQLKRGGKEMKERLFSGEEEFRFSISSSSVSVVKGHLWATFTRDEVQKALAEGFFPFEPLDEAAAKLKRGGLKKMGLSYEDEPSFIRHLAFFLKKHRIEPDFVLFNGGVFKADLFQCCVLDTLKTWFPHKTIESLPSRSLDFAVARGAAYYGKLKLGVGRGVEMGAPCTYFLEMEVQKEKKACVLLTRGAPVGHEFVLPHEFTLRTNTVAQFSVWSSHQRLGDKEGEVVAIDPAEMHEESPFSSLIRFGKGVDQMIPVKLKVKYSEIGVLELTILSCKTDHNWKLEFASSKPTFKMNAQIYNSEEIGSAQELIKKAFSAANDKPLISLMPSL